MAKRKYLRSLSFLWKFFRPHWPWVCLMAQAPILSAVYIFSNNYALKLLVDAFSSTEHYSYNNGLFAIFIFIMAQIGQGVSWRLSNLAEWKIEPYVRQNLLLEVYDHVQNHSIVFFQNIQAGAITSKIKGIMDGYDYILNLHHTLGRSLCIAFLSMIALSLVNLYVFIFVVIWHIILVWIMLPMCLKLECISNEYADSKHKVTSAISDNITNILSILYFSRKEHEMYRLKSLIKVDSVPKHIKLEKYNCKFAMIFNILYCSMLFTVLILLISLKNTQYLSVGSVLFILLTCTTISFNLWDFVTGISEFLKRIGDFNTSFSFLMSSHEKVDFELSRDMTFSNGDVVIKNLTFGYKGNNNIFSDLNLSIKSGEKVGIVGHSGAGKSTLISLLLKLYIIDSGDISIGGINLKDITADSLRQQITLIPQDTMLFHRSIADNIGYGSDNHSVESIKEAARLANIDEFIESLPEKYETQVGERGVKLSGGQRQRIAIARALIKNAPIVVLDEATSNLDSITELKIQSAVTNILNHQQSTVIVIAHRLSTIRNMDRIIVMDGGNIVEDGSFKTLLKNKNGHFSKLWNSQVNNMII